MEDTQLGTVYLPQTGSGVGKFSFILDSQSGGSNVQIGSLVVADTSEGSVVGSVTDMKTIGSDGDPVRILPSRAAGVGIAHMDEAIVAEASVVSSDKLRSVRAGAVRAAKIAEVAKATGRDRMDWPIPVGVTSLVDGSWAGMDVDGSFLMGPEAQGCLVGGRSGVASKTSFVSVLLRSALSRGDEDEHRVAAIVFNVKGEDLVWLDKGVSKGYELTDEDLSIYKAMGLDATPFPDVTVYAPAASGFGGVRSARPDARPIAWDLPMAWRYLRFFFPNMYDDEKMSGFVAQFEDLLLKNPDMHRRVDTFDKLNAWFANEIDMAEQSGASECWGGRVHIATMRRLRRQFDGLRSRGMGLFCGGKSGGGDDIPVEAWRNGQVIVVDLAGVSVEVQGFVIARTIDRLMQSAEQSQLGVDHLAIVTDELNSFAPASGGEMATVRKTLQKVATQGRYAGLALFGCAQQLSKIDELLRDNCSSRALGQSAEAELTSGVHGRLSTGVQERIATLPKGHMTLWHTAYRQPLVVRFPRPAWRMGRSRTTGGAKVLDASSQLRNAISEASYARLTEGVAPEIAEQAMASASSVDEAVERLSGMREIDMTKTAVHEKRQFDSDNPFNME